MAKRKKTKTEESVESSEETLEAEGMEVSSVSSGNLSELPSELLVKLKVDAPEPAPEEEQEEIAEPEASTEDRETKPAIPSVVKKAMEEVEPELEEAKTEETKSPEEPSSEAVPEAVRQALKADGVSDNVIELMEGIRKWSEAEDKDMVRLYRRKIRYRLFRIREGGKMGEQADQGLKSFIEKQFVPGMSWANFTFEWDVAPNNPLMLISKDIINYEWIRLGGEFKNDKKYPPAFTNQA